MLHEISLLKAQGVDLARLRESLAAFAAGGDVDLADADAENAAENNTFWFAIQAVYLLYKAYDLYQTIESVAGLDYVLIDENLTSEEKIDYLEKFVIQFGIEIVIGKSIGDAFEKIIHYVRNNKGTFANAVIDELLEIGHKLGEGTLGDYGIGNGQGNRLDQLDSNESPDDIATASGHVNACKVVDSHCAIDFTADIQAEIDQFVNDFDTLPNIEKGSSLETIVNKVADSDPDVD